MSYSHKVMQHYFAPRYAGSFESDSIHMGTSLIGSPDEGIVVKLQLQVHENAQTIEEVRFKTYGCGCAIAASSLLCECIKGLRLDEAIHMDALALIYELELPPAKYYCARIAVKALKSAVKDYRNKHPLKIAS